QCAVPFFSTTAGTVTGHASATLSVGGLPLTVATDGVAPNSPDAVKTFVDANVQVTPASAQNPVGTTHTVTGHVNVNTGGAAGYVNAPDGTTITFFLSGPGSFAGPTSCTTSGGTGSCQAVVTSGAAGTTKIKASTTVAVGGVSLTRATGDGRPGDGDDAAKTW